MLFIIFFLFFQFRWWKGLALARKLSFSRDRLIESFFWALGMVHEPQYSNSRKEITKAFALVTVIDDVYDVYGTLDELELFTDIVERLNLLFSKSNPLVIAHLISSL